jgi:nitroreductase
MEDILSTIKKRRSIRSFKPKVIPKDFLLQIADAGRYAPTARGIAPWEFVIVTQRDQLDRLAGLIENARFLSQAAACIAVFCKETKYYLEDGCAATQNMLLAATALGIGSCWIAGDKKEYCGDIAAVVGVPALLKLVSLIALGYSAQTKGWSAGSRKELSEIVHWERYGVR